VATPVASVTALGCPATAPFAPVTRSETVAPATGAPASSRTVAVKTCPMLTVLVTVPVGLNVTVGKPLRPGMSSTPLMMACPTVEVVCTTIVPLLSAGSATCSMMAL